MFLRLTRGSRSSLVNMDWIEEILPCSEQGGSALYPKFGGDETGALLFDESPDEIIAMLNEPVAQSYSAV